MKKEEEGLSGRVVVAGGCSLDETVLDSNVSCRLALGFAGGDNFGVTLA